MTRKRLISAANLFCGAGGSSSGFVRAAAMGLEDYTFCGNQTEQIKQIGNAVARRTAQALCGNIMDRICG